MKTKYYIDSEKVKMCKDLANEISDITYKEK